jgi:hypothetical protein
MLAVFSVSDKDDSYTSGFCASFLQLLVRKMMIDSVSSVFSCHGRCMVLLPIAGTFMVVGLIS